CIGIFVDFRKAFDLLNRSLIVQKLANCRVIGKSLQLLESYLSDRYQCVSIQNSKSSELATHSGVPQESVLGPIQFIIAVYDIFNLSNQLSCHLSLFSDDTTCIFYDESIEILTTEIHIFLDRLKIWCENNK